MQQCSSKKTCTNRYPAVVCGLHTLLFYISNCNKLLSNDNNNNNNNIKCMAREINTNTHTPTHIQDMNETQYAFTSHSWYIFSPHFEWKSIWSYIRKSNFFTSNAEKKELIVLKSVWSIVSWLIFNALNSNFKKKDKNWIFFLIRQSDYSSFCCIH